MPFCEICDNPIQLKVGESCPVCKGIRQRKETKNKAKGDKQPIVSFKEQRDAMKKNGCIPKKHFHPLSPFNPNNKNGGKK